MQLNPIFIQKEVLALVFSWQLSDIFNNNFLKRKKTHCYKKRDQISIANLIMQLFI